MKLRTVRFSGLPVSQDNLEAYNAEFQQRYDKIMETCGNDMLKVHEELQKLDAELQQKFQQIESFELPKSAKGWQKLLESFDAPIMLAKSSEGKNELVFVIMDQPLS